MGRTRLKIWKRVSLSLGYQELSWYYFYKLIFNIFRFGFGRVGVFVWDTETKTEIFGFYKMKTETEPHWNRTKILATVRSVSTGFFQFLSFVHTPSSYLI